MSTLEDVFYLYERNSRYYYNCKLDVNNGNDNDNNKQKCCGECYCINKQEVRPFTIGDQDACCELKIKCYIKYGEICPICREEIITKNSAFITNCGHAYHKKCLFKYIQIKWLTSKQTSVARCPMCRTSLGYPEFIQRYKSSYFTVNYKDDNKLDKLEDFWISNELILPCFCSNGYDHYLGMKKECYLCKTYIEKGVTNM